ncbi:MAG: double zinc ribbon domain-containing protein [Pyrinomonadaceae bacterium]
MLRTLSDSVLSVIYPQECRACGEEVEFANDGVSCPTCWSSTKIFLGDETLCNKCGAFLFGGRLSGSAICRKCDDHSYDHVLSIGLYEKALAATIIELKKTPHFSGTARRLLAEALDRSILGNTDVVIPVPLSPRRLHERGFNQAAIIGREVAEHLGVAIDESTLIRKVHTPMHRAGMDKKARAITVKNAFGVVRPNLVENKRVLLVDDIFTSGETASNCAKVLKMSGASTVNVLTIARAA